MFHHLNFIEDKLHVSNAEFILQAKRIKVGKVRVKYRED